MQVPVLPRDLAGQIITSSVSRMGWAVGVTMLVLTIPVLFETLARRDRLEEWPLPLAMLLVVIAGIGFVVWRAAAWAVLVFLAVAGVAAVIYELALIVPDPGIMTHQLFLVNRPAVALVMVGVTATSPFAGVLWACLGYALSWAVTLTVTILAGVPFLPGVGTTMVFAVIVIGYLTLAGIQIAQRRSLPDFAQLESETERLAAGEDLARKTTAAVHDTVLNDLSLVMSGSEQLSPRAQERLLHDLDTLRSAEWITAATSGPAPSERDATLRNDVMRLVSDYQWRGLNLHLTGARGSAYPLAPEVASALLGALGASFENVLRHSGVTTAEVELVYGQDAVTIMVTDQGRGFDPDAVPADRLGLRSSVVDRMTAVGGQVRIWASPGEGTSIVITAPGHPDRPADANLPSGGVR